MPAGCWHPGQLCYWLSWAQQPTGGGFRYFTGLTPWRAAASLLTLSLPTLATRGHMCCGNTSNLLQPVHREGFGQGAKKNPSTRKPRKQRKGGIRWEVGAGFKEREHLAQIGTQKQNLVTEAPRPSPKQTRISRCKRKGAEGGTLSCDQDTRPPPGLHHPW